MRRDRLRERPSVRGLPAHRRTAHRRKARLCLWGRPRGGSPPPGPPRPAPPVYPRGPRRAGQIPWTAGAADFSGQRTDGRHRRETYRPPCPARAGADGPRVLRERLSRTQDRCRESKTDAVPPQHPVRLPGGPWPEDPSATRAAGPSAHVGRRTEPKPPVDLWPNRMRSARPRGPGNGTPVGRRRQARRPPGPDPAAPPERRAQRPRSWHGLGTVLARARSARSDGEARSSTRPWRHGRRPRERPCAVCRCGRLVLCEDVPATGACGA